MSAVIASTVDFVRDKDLTTTIIKELSVREKNPLCMIAISECPRFIAYFITNTGDYGDRGMPKSENGN
jgi:hypothetical protein